MRPLIEGFAQALRYMHKGEICYFQAEDSDIIVSYALFGEKLYLNLGHSWARAYISNDSLEKGKWYCQ